MYEISFAVLGGDARQEKLAKGLEKDGFLVYKFGLNREEENLNSLKEVLEKSKFILLPMPISKNNKDLYAPFSERSISLKYFIKNKNLFFNKFIFMPGINQKKNEFLKNIKDESNYIFKYCTEDFLIKNADLTSKATINIIKDKLGKDLNNLKILICGFGRLGKSLANKLKNDRNNITISARKDKDFEDIKKLGIKSIHTKDIPNTTGYNLIINTIPALIFDETALKNTVKDAFLIDLASNPGGIDKKAAEKLKIKYIHALGLPGKYYPEESSELIKDSVIKIIKDEKLF